MTLNVTVASPWGIHQSTDLRIADPATRRVVDDASPKQVVLLHRPGQNGLWSGVLTYCGFGRSRGKDTHQWLSQWLADIPSRSEPIEIIEVVRAKGSCWLSDIQAQLRISDPHDPRLRHTFILGFFYDRQPRIALISNFERLDRAPQAKPGSAFHVSSVSPRKPFVVVTGLRNAVGANSIKRLKASAVRKAEPLAMRRLLAELNEHASRVERGISPGCMCYSLLPDGSGAGEPHGLGPGVSGFVPSMLHGGTDLSPMVKQLFAGGRGPRQRSNLRLVQTASAIREPPRPRAFSGHLLAPRPFPHTLKGPTKVTYSVSSQRTSDNAGGSPTGVGPRSPEQGINVTFSLTTGSASIDDATEVTIPTDASGRATATLKPISNGWDRLTVRTTLKARAGADEEVTVIDDETFKFDVVNS